VHIISLGCLEFWHFYSILSRGLLFFRTQCILKAHCLRLHITWRCRLIIERDVTALHCDWSVPTCRFSCFAACTVGLGRARRPHDREWGASRRRTTGSFAFNCIILTLSTLTDIVFFRFLGCCIQTAVNWIAGIFVCAEINHFNSLQIMAKLLAVMHCEIK